MPRLYNTGPASHSTKPQRRTRGVAFAHSCTIKSLEIADIAMAMTRSIIKLKGVASADLYRFSAFPCLARTRGLCATAHRAESSAEGIRAESLQQQHLKEKSSSLPEKGRRQRSWMPDPVTGYFIPEDHFGEIDIADLRQNLLRVHPVFRGSN